MPLITRFAALSAFCLLLGATSPASACPNCKEAVAAQPKAADLSSGPNTASGYNWSVMFMVSVPFTMLGTGMFLVTRAARNGALPEL